MSSEQQVDYESLTPQDVANVLAQLFQPNTEVVKKATAFLKDYFKRIKALENLLILMSTSPDQNIRQVSCIYLRKIIGNLWMNLAKDNQEKTKVLLLTRFVEEPAPIVKKNIADVIGSLGKILIPNKEWNELFQFFFQYSSSEQLIDKELGMLLLSVIIEYFSADEIKVYYDALNKIIEGHLQSGIVSLQTLAIETVNKIAQTPKAIRILKKYKNLIPLVIGALQLDQEDMIQRVFETLNEFVEIKKVLAPHLPLLIDAALRISSASDFSLNLREITLLFLEQIAENYSRYLVKRVGVQIIDKIIETGFIIASESEEGYEQEQDTPHLLALYMIFSYSSEVPNNVIYPIVMKYIEKFGSSQKELERKAAIKVLGFVSDSDSCLDSIKENIEAITSYIVTKLQDPSFVVREATAETVGKFSEYVVPDFLDMHQQVMPSLINVLKELTIQNDLTIQKALFALHEFANNLHEDIKPYLNDVVPMLLIYINNHSFSRDVRYWALSALGSVESSAQQRIIPFQEQILKSLYDTVVNPNAGNNELSVKGQALMCAGQLASAVGKEKFPADCIEVFSQHAMKFLTQEDKFELRETAISYFAELARILKSEMAPIINPVLDEIIKSCKSTAGVREELEQKQKEAFSLDTDSEDEADLVGMDVDVNFIDEKSAAVHALGNICLMCPGLILPRIQEILATLEEIQFYFHENIRYHVCMTYLQIAVGLTKHFTNTDEKFKWTKGFPVQNVLPEQVQQLLDTVIFPHFFEIFKDEVNKEVIEKTLECLREMCEELGPGSVVNQIDRIVEVLQLLLEKKAFCQTKAKDFKGEVDEEEEGAEEFQDEEEDEEEDEDDEEDLDHDEIILGNTTDVIIALSRALGDQFMVYLGKLGPSLVKYLDDSHPKSDIVMVVGCLAETFASCKAAIPVYFNDFFSILIKNSKTNDSGLNRNISYALGILAEYSGVLVQPHINVCLEALNAMHQASTEQDAKDNVVSAICRFMQNYPGLVPFDQMLDFVFSKIPFSGDLNENETVLKFAFNLYQQQPEKVLPYMQNVTLACLKILIDEKCDEVPENFKKDVGQFIKNVIMTTQLQLLQDLESKMSQEEKLMLAKYL